MSYNSVFDLDLGEETELYYKLLSEEDFDFRTKDIKIKINKVSSKSLKITIESNSLIELKIGVSALIKSLEIIDKTLKV